MLSMCVENYELKILSDFKLKKAGLMIVYSNQQTKNGQFFKNQVSNYNKIK